MIDNKRTTQQQRKVRASRKVRGSEQQPRLNVFRSNRYIYVQLINDEKGKTLIGLSEKTVDTKGTKTEKAKALGMTLAQKAKEKKIQKAVFDKGVYKYHGRVKAVADGAREGGLQF